MSGVSEIDGATNIVEIECICWDDDVATRAIHTALLSPL